VFEMISNLARRMNPFGGPNSHPTPVPAGMAPRHESTMEVEDPVAMGAFVSQLHDEWAGWRREYEPEWYLNLAFYIGQQYAIWDKGLQQIREMPGPSYRARFVANRIMPTIRTLMGKINRGPQVGRAVPIQTTETAFSDARMAERVLRALHESLSLTEIRYEARLWLLCTGSAFRTVEWDPTIGPQVMLPDGSAMPIGEVAVNCLSPWEVLVPPDIKTPLGPRPFRWMQVSAHDVEVVRATYPDTLGSIEPDAESPESAYLDRVRALMTPLTGDAGRQTRKKGSSVLLVQLNEDPEILAPADRERFPNGRRIVMAYQRRVIGAMDENPYQSPYPTGTRNRLVMDRDDVMPGRFWGMSRISQLAPIQTNYNRGRSQIIEARDLCTKPKINVEKNHQIPKITNQPGEILERRIGSSPPTYMAPPQMSDFLVKDILDSKEEFQEISQIAEVSRGQSPQANTSGIAIDMLQEADNTPLGPLATNLAAGESRLQTLIYKTCQQFYDEQRTLSYVGENQEEDVFTFHADKSPTSLRIRVTPAEIFPESSAARRVKIQEAVGMGVLDPLKDRAAILRGLEFGDVDSALDNADLDRQRAQWENRQMTESGVLPQVETFDDHEIHVYYHNRLMKSPEWLKLPPEIKQLFIEHTNAHLAMMAQAVSAVASVGGAGPEAPGDASAPPGAPSPGSPPKGPPAPGGGGMSPNGG